MHLPGGMEMVVLLLIVVVLFGGAKLPQLMKGVGEGMREFKKATREDDDVRPIASPSTTPSSNTPNDPRVQ
ncbi:Sec-independent protein translocase protein TatA [Abditibacteriota bacterium]|nr:Sec-independent protein translocase protein TatA [Abditibacteriota bacterium]